MQFYPPVETDTDFREYSGNDDAFAGWLSKLDALVIDTYGMGVMDFPDHLWRDDYDSLLSPAEALEAAQEEGWPED